MTHLLTSEAVLFCCCSAFFPLFPRASKNMQLCSYAFSLSVTPEIQVKWKGVPKSSPTITSFYIYLEREGERDRDI